jgi:hypothetical protein
MMRYSRPLILSTILSVGILATQFAPAFAQTCTCPTVQDDGSGPPGGAAGIAVYADEAPPPLPEYDQPPIPTDGDIWTPGYWAWNGYEYFWVPGTWVEPPHPGLLWTPGYWAFVGGSYGFHRGYWGQRVGFYGGVDYGFGYVGVGFAGGRWDNDRFIYNRAVTNVGRVNINVYNEPVTIREANRVSFNGGPNGLDARPSPAELEAAKAPHVAPTRDQLQNARVASHTDSAFVSANKGKPRVAATAKPGEFKGDAVIPAKAAGGPLPPPGATPGALEPKGVATPPEPTKTPLEKKLETPKPGATEVKPDKTLAPLKPEPTKSPMEMKTDRPTPEPTKTPMEMKVDRPKPEPTKAPMEMKVDRPKPEPTKAPMEMKVDRPKPEPTRAEPQPKPQGAKPERACGRPGEPPCPR